MAIIKESRPGQSSRIELGGSYAQPNASVHATWAGQAVRQLNWAGERNAGQPVYAAFDYNQNQTEIESRFRSDAGETIEQIQRDPQSVINSNGTDEVGKNRLTMQLFTLTSEA